jgi:DeoR family transcriptional regulator, fructose operon transcriptional repressor
MSTIILCVFARFSRFSSNFAVYYIHFYCICAVILAFSIIFILERALLTFIERRFNIQTINETKEHCVAVMIPIERRKKILDLLVKKQSVRVSDLSEEFDVSEATIRRDLDVMEQEGLLEKYHGGAVIGHHLTIEPLYDQKQTSFYPEKHKIGSLGATLIQDGETVFIGAGTTTLQIFPNLTNLGVQIITTNIGFITEKQTQGIQVTLTGGNYRHKSHSLIGPASILSLQHYHASKCFIGTDGISLKHGLTTPLVEEAMLLKTMLERTHGMKILLADHSKFGVVSSVKVCSVGDIDVIVSDSALNPAYIQDLESMGIKVLIAG